MTHAGDRPPLLRAESLDKRFGATRALSGVSLEIRAGEIHALAGENGAGKSTLVRILAGIHAPDHGRILIDGEEVRIGSPHDALDRGLAFIYQDFDLAPNLSVAENLVLNREPVRLPGLIDHAQEARAAREQMKRVGIALDPGRLVRDLAVAERQLLAIARSLSHSCRLLVMDEPTSALAADDIRRLLELTTRLRRHGTAVLYISHKLDEVFAISDRITVLRDGRNVRTLKTGESSAGEVVKLMIGRELEARRRVNAGAGGEVLLEVGNLRSRSVEVVGFTLSRGEVLGLYGLQGAGRTALARTLFGLEDRTDGAVELDGAPVDIRSPRDAMRLGLAYASRDRKVQGLFPNFDVRENVSIASLRRYSRLGFIRRRVENRAVRERLKQLKVRSASLHQSITDLSGGNQQKAILARWLLLEPRILMLDDPTAGIDVGARSEIYRLIETLSARGMGLLLITSDLPELLALSHRVLVMREGRIVGELGGDNATEDAIMQAIHAPGATGARNREGAA